MSTTTEIAGKAARGAAEGRAELFRRVVARIDRYFRSQIWDPGEAEECMQRTLFELETSLRERTYDPARSFNTWMWLKARTEFAKWCRERARRPAPLSPLDGESDPAAPPERLPADERLDAATVLREVQRRLGPEAYEAFVLHYQGGLTRVEVADALGCDRKTVAKRIEAAHALIDRLLGRNAP